MSRSCSSARSNSKDNRIDTGPKVQLNTVIEPFEFVDELIDISTDILQLLSCSSLLFINKQELTEDNVHLSVLCSLHSGPGRHSFVAV